MNCELARYLIDDYVEKGLGHRDRVQLEKHLAGCARCAELLRLRPALDRDVQRALASMVHPLFLSRDASARLVGAAEVSVQRAISAQRVARSVQVVATVVAVVLVAVGVFALLGYLPVPSHLSPTTLLPLRRLPVAGPVLVNLSVQEQSMLDLAADSSGRQPRSGMLVEPRHMRPRDSFTVTVFYQSDLPEPIESARVDLEIDGPTGSYRFRLKMKGPLPPHATSIYKVTPELLDEPCREQYLIPAIDLFSIPGVYSVGISLYEPVVASQ